MSPALRAQYESFVGDLYEQLVERVAADRGLAGDRVRARAVSAGGQSGHPQSRHFNDQAARYAAGALREVYFYPDQLKGHAVRVYRP